MKNYLQHISLILLLASTLIGCSTKLLDTEQSTCDLQFKELAETWDEGIPLGNATIGALVWKKGENLRLSLDRTDLWDLRPMDSISGDNNRFSWVIEQVKKGDYLPVQKKFDHPYDRSPAPSKIPGAALEFNLANIGEPNSVHLFLNNALCEVKWDNKTSLKTFVHANEPIGWFIFENLQDSVEIKLVPPTYSKGVASSIMDPVTGLDLRRLGYKQGEIKTGQHKITYHQQGWKNYTYDVAIEWKRQGTTLCGTWSITSSLVKDKAEELTHTALNRGIEKDYNDHMVFWNNFWSKSSVTLPDKVLQKQYNNEIYKFGSTTREDSYPISLQAVWTADNGKLPPWKGDYHHDLNTQLSYWPAYTGNYLNEGLGYLNTLWKQRDTYRKYTKEYFNVDGLNVPGVCTLLGEPMGGWIQYSMSPTVAAWLAHHFYLHWKYSSDRTFLKERAYPFIKEVATFLHHITYLDKQGIRQLPLSSSPEIHNNSIKAWFKTMTNFDNALISFIFKAAAELAEELDLNKEALHWNRLKEELPKLDLDKDGALTFAKGYPYNGSHRHLSHALAIHPLGLLDWANGAEDRKVIEATINKIESYGPDFWTGYTYSWFGIMKARMHDGEAAAQYLKDFAQHFCLKNTFHANGDQTKTGKSKMTYRPFTLEGNFAFASGIQEMLLQSHAGYIHLFPAIPSIWHNVEFKQLRAMGAFLVSAKKKEGVIQEVIILSEQGDELRLRSPFENDQLLINGEPYITPLDGIIRIPTTAGEVITIQSVLSKQ